MQTLVFCNMISEVKRLYLLLKRFGFSAAQLHSELPQIRRQEQLQLFRHGTVNILIATDVAARGIDIGSVRAVVNFQPPYHY